MLLLTAANGNQGRLLVPRLLEAGIPFRACTRSPESAEMLRAQGVADIIVGDIAERKIIARDRKSVVLGKRLSVRVALGGRRVIKKKKSQKTNIVDYR